MMGNPGMLYELPDIPALLSEDGRDCQQVAVADRTCRDWMPRLLLGYSLILR
jgi:hypothetical protein